MLKPNEKLEVGDLVDCQFHLLRFEGVVVEINDGSGKVPGELMYFVEIPNQGAVWLKGYEIIHKLDADGALRMALQVYTRRQLQVARVKFNIAMAKLVAAKGTRTPKFRGQL